jgi:hypothetical protein
MSYRTIVKRYTCLQQVLIIALHFMSTARSETRFVRYAAIINIQFMEQGALLFYYMYSRAVVRTFWERSSNQEKPDRQFTYNLTFRGVSATPFPAEKQ